MVNVQVEPTILHPNEMLDGALVNGNYRQPGRAITYAHSHNSMVRELYRRHGDLNFLGVVIGRGWQDSQFLKERQGWMMARVARLWGRKWPFSPPIWAAQEATIPLISCAPLKPVNNSGYAPLPCCKVGEPGWQRSDTGRLCCRSERPGERRGHRLAHSCCASCGARHRWHHCAPSIAEEPRAAAGPLQVDCWYGAIWKRSELGLSAVDV